MLLMFSRNFNTINLFDTRIRCAVSTRLTISELSTSPSSLPRKLENASRISQLTNFPLNLRNFLQAYSYSLLSLWVRQSTSIIFLTIPKINLLRLVVQRSLPFLALLRFVTFAMLMFICCGMLLPKGLSPPRSHSGHLLSFAIFAVSLCLIQSAGCSYSGSMARLGLGMGDSISKGTKRLDRSSMQHSSNQGLLLIVLQSQQQSNAKDHNITPSNRPPQKETFPLRSLPGVAGDSKPARSLFRDLYMKSEQQPIESSRELRALHNYKRRLLVQTLILFAICFLFLIERVFYQMVVHSEQDLLHRFQLNNHLITENDYGTLPADISASFFQLWAYLSRFQVQFLILTHVLLTVYVIFDSKIAAKVMFASFGIIQVVTFFQLIYQGARPFWNSEGIKSSACLRNYTHPDIGSILLMFLPAYTYYCWKQKNRSFIDSPHNKCNNFGFFAVAAFTLLVFFLNYATGVVFIFNICFSSLFAIVFFILLTFLNGNLDKSLKTLLHRKTAQSSQIKWLFLILFSLLFVLMTYSATISFKDTEWIKNYMSCKEDLNQSQSFVSYDRIVGAWYTFNQSAVSLAWIGAVLGLSYCYSVISSRQWCKGNTKMRLVNFLAANAMLIPSWVFEVVLKDEDWIRSIGLNSFIVDGVHYFLLYLWLFGFMPPLVLQRLLGTTETLNYSDTESKR